MNGKKLVIFLFSLLLLISLVSCKSAPADTPEDTPTPEPTATPVPTDTPEPTPSPTPKPTREPHSDENPYYGSIVSEDPVRVPLFTHNDPNAVHLPEQLFEHTTVAWQFVATTHFNAIELCMCTWHEPDGATNFSIYKWNYDYDKTISGDPLVTYVKENIQDNDEVKFELEEPLPPDEYLVVINDNLGTKIGVWKVPYNEDEPYENVKFYINDFEVEDFLPQSYIYYVNTPEVKLLPVSQP